MRIVTTTDKSHDNQRQVAIALSQLGWARPFELSIWLRNINGLSQQMTRRACEQLVASGLAQKFPLERGFQAAYRLTKTGRQAVRDQGIPVTEKLENVQPGPRWHEHALITAFFALVREKKDRVYFGRDIAWSELSDGVLWLGGEDPIPKLRKRPDGIWMHGHGVDRERTDIECEWARKTGADAKSQAERIVATLMHRDPGHSIHLVYPYPPKHFERLLDRLKRPALSIDHETRLTNQFYATTPPEDHRTFDKIFLTRLYLNDHLELQQIKATPLSTMKPCFTQPVGGDREIGRQSKRRSSVWSNPRFREDDDGELEIIAMHLPSNWWVRAHQRYNSLFIGGIIVIEFWRQIPDNDRPITARAKTIEIPGMLTEDTMHSAWKRIKPQALNVIVQLGPNGIVNDKLYGFVLK